jgi:hypothetical protein
MMTSTRPHCICSRVIHIGGEKSIPSVTPMHREYD